MHMWPCSRFGAYIISRDGRLQWAFSQFSPLPYRCKALVIRPACKHTSNQSLFLDQLPLDNSDTQLPCPYHLQDILVAAIGIN